MAKNVSLADEAYEAFKARKRKEFDTRHAGRTHTTQQKLLRVHLQHFLVTVGAEIDRERGADSGVAQQKKNGDTKTNGVDVVRSFANEQKRLAIAREATKAKRHRSARTIQNFVHRRRQVRGYEIRENEEELSSTSILIPLIVEIEKPAVPKKAIAEIIPATVDIIPVDPLPKATLPPYEVVIELVAARGLELGFAPIGALDGKYIETELLLKRQSTAIARVVPTKQFVSSFQDTKAEIQLQDCSLKFSLDLNNGMRHGLASPQSVIDELSATVVVKTTENSGGSNSNILGVVGIPLSLLETPFATEYALCRWFPLEKAYLGHIVRGDLRISVCYLMRQTSSNSITMVPYVNTAILKTTSNEAEVQQNRKKRIARRVKKTRGTAVTHQNLPGKSFQRKIAKQPPAKSDKRNFPVLSLKDAMSSPIGRISRAEALSPPPSPSSVASSSTGESIESPIPQRQTKPSRRFFPPKRKQKFSKPVESAPTKDEQVVETKSNSPQPPPKNFLKRKPYKVVFHKLDWSRVASKTDSNLPTSGNSRSNPGVASQSSKTSRSSSQVSNSSITTNSSGYAGTEAESTITSKSDAFIDEATAQRLAALEIAMYERCGVTRETASLARFKYQTERKKFVATLQSQVQTRRDMETSTESDQPPSQDSGEVETCTATSEATVTELWKKLSGDSSGQIYASMLRNLIEKATKPIEPTEPGIVS